MKDIIKNHKTGIKQVQVSDDYLLKPDELLITHDLLKSLSKLLQPKIADGLLIESASNDELSAFARQKEYESDLEFARQKKADGQQFYEEIDARQVSMMRGKTPDEIDDLDVEYKRKILPYIEVVNGGQWWTAKRMIDNTTLPKIPEIKTLFLEVRQHIRNYVNENYI